MKKRARIIYIMLISLIIIVNFIWYFNFSSTALNKKDEKSKEEITNTYKDVTTLKEEVNDKVEEDKLPQATVNTKDTSETITEDILPPIGYYSNEDITEQKYKELKDLTVEELERLKQIVIENRDSKLLTYREIQKMFDLVDKITFDTPTECNKLISRKRKGSIRLNKPQERCTGFGEEIF